MRLPPFRLLPKTVWRVPTSMFVLGILLTTHCVVPTGPSASRTQPRAAGSHTTSSPAASKLEASSTPHADPKVSFSGGDGSSCSAAVTISGARHSFDGVAAEHHWIQQRYPGARIEKQRFISCGDRPTDRLTIVDQSGKRIRVYFDISRFFRPD